MKSRVFPCNLVKLLRLFSFISCSFLATTRADVCATILYFLPAALLQSGCQVTDTQPDIFSEK